jgi:hypothetical protein
VAFIAKSRGHDALFVRNIKVETSAARDPVAGAQGTGNPMRDEVVLSATFQSTDLVLVNSGRQDAPAHHRCSGSAHAALFPDGNRIVFVYYLEVTPPVTTTNLRAAREAQARQIDFLSPNNVHGELRHLGIRHGDGKSRLLVERRARHRALHHAGWQDNHLRIG